LTWDNEKRQKAQDEGSTKFGKERQRKFKKIVGFSSKEKKVHDLRQ